MGALLNISVSRIIKPSLAKITNVGIGIGYVVSVGPDAESGVVGGFDGGTVWFARDGQWGRLYAGHKRPG